eukprot:scaffold5988_cov381-Prasinococcus_capsulatus_cf.AAC.9
MALRHEREAFGLHASEFSQWAYVLKVGRNRKASDDSAIVALCGPYNVRDMSRMQDQCIDRKDICAKLYCECTFKHLNYILGKNYSSARPMRAFAEAFKS